MTKAIYKATAEYELDAKQRPVKHRVSVSGILKHLGVSRSGYHAWKKRIPSDTQKRREEITQKIQEIYEESHQNYGAPKITKELQKANIQISEKTAGMINSYSKKAYPWDNACIESFHALIKREWLNRFKIFNYKHAYRLVFEYIETFYNTVRIHSHCGYLSPEEYEENYLTKTEGNVSAIAS
jgi:hypothetical protein